MRRRFQKNYCQMYHTILSDIVKAILQNGGHFRSSTSISETKRRRAFNVDSMYRFCGAYISEKVLSNVSSHYILHCLIHFYKMPAISKVTRLSQNLRGAEPPMLTLFIGFVGRRFQKKIIAEYIMPLYSPFWRPFNTKWRPFFKK